MQARVEGQLRNVAQQQEEEAQERKKKKKKNKGKKRAEYWSKQLAKWEGITEANAKAKAAPKSMPSQSSKDSVDLTLDDDDIVETGGEKASSSTVAVKLEPSASDAAGSNLASSDSLGAGGSSASLDPAVSALLSQAIDDMDKKLNPATY